MIKKKAILTSVILAAGLFVIPVWASQQSAMDYSSMSLEELVSLRDEINVEIGARGGDNVISQGTYVVGTDIKAASFKATIIHGDAYAYASFILYDDEDAYKAGTQRSNYSISYNENDDITQSLNLNLKEGQVLVIEGNSAVLEQAKASWMPDSKDTDE